MKTMTTQELSDFFGKSKSSILRTAKKLGLIFEERKTKQFDREEVKKLSEHFYKRVPFPIKNAIDDFFLEDNIQEPMTIATYKTGQFVQDINVANKLIQEFQEAFFMLYYQHQEIKQKHQKLLVDDTKEITQEDIENIANDVLDIL